MYWKNFEIFLKFFSQVQYNPFFGGKRGFFGGGNLASL